MQPAGPSYNLSTHFDDNLRDIPDDLTLQPYLDFAYQHYGKSPFD
jgi:hypothetical protein